MVVTDLVMPEMSGMELLERVVEFDPSIEVILMTPHYSNESAVEAIERGACDYLSKPVPSGVLTERIERLLNDSIRRRRAEELEKELLEQSTFEGLVGRSPQMREIFSRVRRLAPHYRTALISGETGTEKDLVARALHRHSPVASANFVVLDGAAVVETIEQARGGTLFLEEIGGVPAPSQTKILRALEDLRVIAATAGLTAAVEPRVKEVEIHIPALVERKEDLPLLLRHLIARFAPQYDKRINGVSRRAQIVLSRYEWPGNVRELESVLAHACMMASGEVIDLADLPDSMTGAGQPAAPVAPETADGIYNTLEEHERMLIVKAFEQSGNNQSRTARILRIGRDALRYKLKKYKIAL